MSRSITEPSTAAIGHSPEVAQAYQAAAANVRQRQESGLPPAGTAARPPVATPEPPLPLLGIARHAWGKEVHALALRAEFLRRQVEAQPTPPNGNAYGFQAQAAMLAANREQARAGLASVEQEIARLEAMSDHAAQVWARDEKGVR